MPGDLSRSADRSRKQAVKEISILTFLGTECPLVKFMPRNSLESWLARVKNTVVFLPSTQSAGRWADRDRSLASAVRSSIQKDPSAGVADPAAGDARRNVVDSIERACWPSAGSMTTAFRRTGSSSATKAETHESIDARRNLRCEEKSAGRRNCRGCCSPTRLGTRGRQRYRDHSKQVARIMNDRCVCSHYRRSRCSR